MSFATWLSHLNHDEAIIIPAQPIESAVMDEMSRLERLTHPSESSVEDVDSQPVAPDEVAVQPEGSSTVLIIIERKRGRVGETWKSACLIDLNKNKQSNFIYY